MLSERMQQSIAVSVTYVNRAFPNSYILKMNLQGTRSEEKRKWQMALSRWLRYLLKCTPVLLTNISAIYLLHTWLISDKYKPEGEVYRKSSMMDIIVFNLEFCIGFGIGRCSSLSIFLLTMFVVIVFQKQDWGLPKELPFFISHSLMTSAYITLSRLCGSFLSLIVGYPKIKDVVKNQTNESIGLIDCFLFGSISVFFVTIQTIQRYVPDQDLEGSIALFASCCFTFAAICKVIKEKFSKNFHKGNSADDDIGMKGAENIEEGNDRYIGSNFLKRLKKCLVFCIIIVIFCFSGILKVYTLKYFAHNLYPSVFSPYYTSIILLYPIINVIIHILIGPLSDRIEQHIHQARFSEKSFAIFIASGFFVVLYSTTNIIASYCFEATVCGVVAGLSWKAISVLGSKVGVHVDIGYTWSSTLLLSSLIGISLVEEELKPIPFEISKGFIPLCIVCTFLTIVLLIFLCKFLSNHRAS